VEPGGNFGDELIYKGAYKLARWAGLRFTALSHNEYMSASLSKDTVIYIHGSGRFTDMWSLTPIDELKKALSDMTDTIIVGPSTFQVENEAVLGIMKKILSKHQNRQIYIFCREELSRKALEEVVPDGVILELDHDTALNLVAEDLIMRRMPGQYTLFAIREDKEAVKIQRPGPCNLWLDPIMNSMNIDKWVEVHYKASEVVTNRLHSAILASILGRKVKLLPNSYHKNRSVWEYSLRSRGVKWMEDLPISKLEEFVCKSKLYRKFLNSFKLKMLTQKMYHLD